MTFQPGQSGNPNGRPRGACNKANVLVQKLSEGRGEIIADKLLELAEGGAMPAIRMCMDRWAPVRKQQPVTCELPALRKPADCVAAAAAIVLRRTIARILASLVDLAQTPRGREDDAGRRRGYSR